MTWGALLSFTIVAVLTVVTPGLDTLLVVRTSLLSGRRAGVAVVLGTTLGCLVWATAGLVGLTALLATSRFAYDVVRIAGAIYLVYLGITALRGSREQTEEPRPATSVRSALRMGMVTNLLNPKPGVFYISLLPQFLPAEGSAAWGALLVGLHLTIGLIWLPFVAWTADRARRILLRDKVKLWFDRVTASVLIGLGVKLALSDR